MEIRSHEAKSICNQNSFEIIKTYFEFEIMAHSFKMIEFERRLLSGVKYYADPVLKN